MSGSTPGLRRFRFQTAERRKLQHEFLAFDPPPSRTRTDLHFQSFLLRGSTRRRHCILEIFCDQALPEELRDDKSIWIERYRSIVDLERHLFRNGTRTVKIFLHLSLEEQRRRFLERLDEPDKNWKFSLAAHSRSEHIVKQHV